MKLNVLLKDLATDVPDVEISGITNDSREVKKGFLFFCSAAKNREKYIKQAEDNGAAAIVGDEAIKVENIYEAMAVAASRFYARQPKHIMAVTGTNGKTSVVTYVSELVEMLGQKAASLGTIGLTIGKEHFKGENTTPGAIEIHQILDDLCERGVDYMAFEASSHGIDQHRIDGVKLHIAGFTNLTQDHLDYHHNMANYFRAKEVLFTKLLDKDGIAVLNADVPEFENLKKCGRKIISYGRNADDLKLVSNEVEGNKQKFAVEVGGKRHEITISVAGYFQVMNILCAIGLVWASGFEIEKIMECVKDLKAPCGRLDLAGVYNGADIYVDYAHTPDALENALKALHNHVRSKLAVVFGCGGNRDKTKRPIMGRIAHELADRVYVTDDNPRFEDAAVIRREVLSGCPKGIDAGDRENAIRMAMAELKPGDVLLLAGKGHETTQVVGDEEIEFSDIGKVKELIASWQ